MSGRFNVVFAGNMGKAQALEAVIDAAGLVAGRAPKVQFVFVGGGIEVDNLKAKVRDMGLSNVQFVPQMPVGEAAKVLVLADVLLVHLRDEPLFRITIPSKTQAYMAAGRPILMCVPGDAADLVTRAEAGICCNPEDPDSIAAGVLRLSALPTDELEAMGRRGKDFYEREMSIAVGARKFEKCFYAAIGGRAK
jgi:glycosyltransferase involved in cell wall biosynthesis